MPVTYTGGKYIAARTANVLHRCCACLVCCTCCALPLTYFVALCCVGNCARDNEDEKTTKRSDSEGGLKQCNGGPHGRARQPGTLH
jgi:hypothetical protein